ncbi:integrin alpha-E isoform X2 [Triplophysa rosa]|uniref:integrin alpha-E isoform X2 n=1 Tax=Triplophysa rosa TaxID=992332 RepID=UPI00254627CA|nr:integrin alpha-E isoform X2 [Triplophysa rosa]
MYRGVIFMIVICSVNGFNIQTSPVKNFTNDDPLFGQTVINSKDGVLVPSPTSGKLFKCTLKKDCDLVNSHGETTKGLKPIASVAASVISEGEHLLVCNQIHTQKQSTDYLNGNCIMINVEGKVKLNPYELVSNLNATHNNINNEGVKGRRKRDAQGSTDTKANEDEEPGTEIAFVLDGSGSIKPDDFQKAKDFIYNVMLNVWKTCFDCDFAIVQYGFDIRTELSLLDNKESARALEKVKEIEQIQRFTKTASAIHHVLTNIFVPENGSKKNSRKMIIVLSDGEILGDPMNLTDVLNMTQMEGVTRFAIGVGDDLKPEAVQEMKEIADANKFFHVSNYAALYNILSQLEQSITGIEGTGGFQLQLAEAGFSSHIMHDRSLLFGAVGAYDWSGGLIVKSDDRVTFFNASNNGPKFSYLGYSVASAHLPSKTLYISGAPRYNLTGGVFIFEGSEKYVLQGEQVGSYYGSVICALDIDMNGYTDYLLVGAPHFHQYGEEGKVLVYRLNQERFESVDMELQGDAGQTFARFGAAIASIGDIDGNWHGDVAVGAPLETDASGRIYIYNGFKDGLRFSQKISPSDFGWKLVNFGQSVSSISSTTQNKPWIAVGSQGKVAVFETIPVMIIKPTIKIEPKIISLSKQTMSSMFDKFNVCFNINKGKLQHETLSIQYQIDLDFGQNKKRLSVGGESLLKTDFTLDPHNECTGHIRLNYLGCYDCFSPIKIKLNFSLAPNSIGTPIRILDVFSQTEIFDEISFEKECGNPEVCKPKITLSNSKISETLIIIGETQSLNIHFHLSNTEDLSYMTTLSLTYPNILSLKKTEGHCPVRKEGHIQCLPLYPEVVFRRGEQTNISISWQLNDTKPDLHQLINSEIIANLTSTNEGTQVLDYKIYKFDVKYSLPIQITGTATPNRFRIEGGKTDTSKLQFIFEFVGENKYGATIDVVVNITKDTFNTDVIVDKVTPKECLAPTNKVKASYLIRCSMKELQKIIIDATVSIRDVQEKSDKIIAVAQYSFNETIYASKNTLRTATVEVFITKLAVTSSKGPIIGGSIGGLLLLIIIIIILIKCGFFRRRRKMDQAQSPN